MRLLDALNQASAQDLAQIRAAIAESENHLAALRQLETLLDIRLQAQTPKKPPVSGQAAPPKQAAGVSDPLAVIEPHAAEPAAMNGAAVRQTDADEPDDGRPGEMDLISPPPAGTRQEATYHRRIAMAKLLLDGPMRQSDICRQLNLSGGGTIVKLVAHPFFGRGADGSVHVTAAGRTAATGKLAIP